MAQKIRVSRHLHLIMGRRISIDPTQDLKEYGVQSLMWNLFRWADRYWLPPQRLALESWQTKFLVDLRSIIVDPWLPGKRRAAPTTVVLLRRVAFWNVAH